MGFVLLGTVIYLMTSLRQDLLLYTVAFLVFVGMGCWWWGRFASFDQKPLARYGTLAVALLFVGVGARASFVDLRGLFEGTSTSDDHLTWVDFDPYALERYHEEGRSVFVDFTADWCPNCKFNEKFVFDSAPVRKSIDAKGVIAMKADITGSSPETDAIERLMKKLGARSIPFLAVFPGDDPTKPIVRFDIVSKEGMVEVFNACPEPKR
jgi:suppressor for copper-sensitivity B